MADVPAEQGAGRDPGPGEAAAKAGGNHFCCALTAVLLARVNAHGGRDAVAELLERAGSPRSAAYLADIGNWISCGEMYALWEAGREVTGDPDFARHLGEEVLQRLSASSTSTVLRGLGSQEELLRKTGVAGRRFSVVADLEAVEVRPGYGEIRATASEGFERHALHCEWTQGLLTQGPVLFGLPPATVEHPTCQPAGDEECRYVIRWVDAADPAREVDALRIQLAAMSQRLEDMFATASDLITDDDPAHTLAKIVERAALQVRAPRHVLAVKPFAGGELVFHQRGVEDDAAAELAAYVYEQDPSTHPDHWLVVPVRSRRNHYGALAAMYQRGEQFFPAERQLLEVYARYAATALDGASALIEARERHDEAQQRYRETTALLDLARRVATAGSSTEVAGRMVEAVPAVVDCDRVSVYVWDPETEEAVRAAASGVAASDAPRRVKAADVPALADMVEHLRTDPVFIDLQTSPLRDALRSFDAVASVAVPIATDDEWLGAVVVSVTSRPERLEDSTELRDRLSGVAAHAAQALQNGRLVDRITHQAGHDPVTDLVNRAGFAASLAKGRTACGERDGSLALFYIDLDRFKPINDEFGHDTGDELLRSVGARLAAQVRSTDTVARLGGDEFAVLVEFAGREQIEELAARIETCFEAPFAIAGHSLRMGASAGRAECPGDVGDCDQLMRAADRAMYEQKRRRNRAAALGEQVTRH